jgi:hypothetical protein
MPVAIRSLNGYYGFLDSLRSLEMTTVTEQIPIDRGVAISHQRLLLGEKLSAQLTDVGINGVFAPHPSKIRDFCHLLPREKALDCNAIQLLDKLGFGGQSR